MAHSDEKRAEVRTGYITGLGLEAAASRAEVSLATARRWKSAARDEGDDWDRFRRVNLIVAGGEIEQALARVLAATLLRAEQTLEKLEDSDAFDPLEAAGAIAKMMDSISKGRAAAQQLMPQTNRLAVASDVLRRLVEFVRAKSPQHAGALAELLSQFGEELAKSYGN